MNHYLSLLFGAACAAGGGELFVRGAVGLARWARVSPAIIAVTVAAFGTSSPEFAVAVSSALAEKPQIALGDALGANILNLALIFALVLMIAPITIGRKDVLRDFPVALALPVALAVLLLDGGLSQVDAAVLLVVFFGWLVTAMAEARRQRGSVGAMAGERGGWRSTVSVCAGLVLLILAGNFIVSGAAGIARSFGIDEFVIGATIVAVGTTVPELATAVIARLRGQDEIALGTLLGSNIFNAAFIIGVAALIYPIVVPWRTVAPALLFGFVAVALAFPGADSRIGRRRGAILLALYVGYVAVILRSGSEVVPGAF